MRGEAGEGCNGPCGGIRDVRARLAAGSVASAEMRLTHNLCSAALCCSSLCPARAPYYPFPHPPTSPRPLHHSNLTQPPTHVSIGLFSSFILSGKRAGGSRRCRALQLNAGRRWRMSGGVPAPPAPPPSGRPPPPPPLPPPPPPPFPTFARAAERPPPPTTACPTPSQTSPYSPSFERYPPSPSPPSNPAPRHRPATATRTGPLSSAQLVEPFMSSGWNGTNGLVEGEEGVAVAERNRDNIWGTPGSN